MVKRRRAEEEPESPIVQLTTAADPVAATCPLTDPVVTSFPRLADRPHVDTSIIRGAGVTTLVQAATTDAALSPVVRGVLSELIGLAAAQSNSTAAGALLLAVEVVLEQSVLAHVFATSGSAVAGFIGGKLREARGHPRRLTPEDVAATHGDAIAAMTRRPPHVFAGVPTLSPSFGGGPATAWGSGRRPQGGPTVARFHAPRRSWFHPGETRPPPRPGGWFPPTRG